MNPIVQDLVIEAFDTLTGNQLMNICKHGSELMGNSSVAYDDLREIDQAAITTLQVVLAYLTELGVIEDVTVLH